MFMFKEFKKTTQRKMSRKPGDLISIRSYHSKMFLNLYIYCVRSVFMLGFSMAGAPQQSKVSRLLSLDVWKSQSPAPHLSLFLRTLTSRFMESADSVASSSSRCSFLRLALALCASSSASSSWRFSCFMREFSFSAWTETMRKPPC